MVSQIHRGREHEVALMFPWIVRRLLFEEVFNDISEN